MVLRGCTLRNTKHICGLVVYTGHDTKVMLNSYKARAKKSHLEIKMGKLVILLFIIELCLCGLTSLYYSIYYQMNKGQLSYLEIDSDAVADNNFGYNLVVRFGNWLLIFSQLVPISLLVTLEMVKLAQALCMQFDKTMHTKQSLLGQGGEASAKTLSASVQSSNLNEELGQVRYIFSDKTGTLTCNVMEFSQVCINGLIYGKLA